jgi:hypothetical protein
MLKFSELWKGKMLEEYKVLRHENWLILLENSDW